MFESWKQPHVLFHLYNLRFILPQQRRAMFNRMETDYLRLDISAAPIDEDIIGDFHHPLKALQQGHIILNKHPSYLLHHRHSYQILNNLLKILEIPSRPLRSPNRLVQFLGRTSH